MTEVHVGVGKCMKVVERVVGEMGSAPVKVGGGNGDDDRGNS